MSSTYVRVPCKVVYCTSQDMYHPATELRHGSVVGDGWQSESFADFPQEIGFWLLDGISSVTQLQIMAHSSKIPKRVDIYSATMSPSGYEEAHFQYVGFVEFSNNRQSEYTAAEMKTIAVDFKATYIKLLLTGCHLNKLNLQHQVGLLAVNISGLPPRDRGADLAHIRKSVATPVTSGHGAGLNVRPSNDTLNDVMHFLEEKCAHVSDANIKQSVEHILSQVGNISSEVTRLLAKKQDAVLSEDYEHAMTLKDQIDVKISTAFDLRQQAVILMDGGAIDPVIRDISTPAHLKPPRSPFEGVRPATGNERQPGLEPTAESETRESGEADDNAEGVLRTHQHIVDVIGDEALQQVLNALWSERVHGYEQIFSGVTNKKYSLNKETVTTIFEVLMQWGLDDKVEKVFLKALDCFAVTIVAAQGHFAAHDMHHWAKLLMPLLHIRLGDTNARIRDGTAKALVEVADGKAFGPTAVGSYIIGDHRNKTLWRMIVTQLEVVLQILKKYGLAKEGAFTEKHVMNTTVPLLDHSHGDVRNYAVTVVGQVYSLSGKGVAKYLKGQRLAILQHLQREFDAINDAAKKPKESVVPTTKRELNPPKAENGGPPPTEEETAKMAAMREQIDALKAVAASAGIDTSGGAKTGGGKDKSTPRKAAPAKT
eukprot:GFYU01007425.1.p1 GENE.GFYU01007425.1~~GFYU01007425.1.p1  ORF type:complete len:654 (-),score=156.65 GFYU01007425.1:133-2094(-)